MAFKNGLSERLDELRFASPRSPKSDAPFSAYTPLSPGQSSLMSAFQPRPSTDVRTHMPRRFTTDASKFSSWSFLNQLSSDSGDPLTSATNLHKSQLIERKRQTIEYMREQKKRFEADMKLLDLQQEKERREIDQLARDLAQSGLSGPVSEPTTPPEHRDAGFPSAFSRPSRFSTSSVTSSPGIFNIFSPSQTSQVTSPSGQSRSGSTAQTPTNRFSVQSVPGSRRNSEADEFSPEPLTYRPGPLPHRYSMPTTSLAAQLRSPTTAFSNSTLDSFNASKYLFPSEEDRATPKDDDRLPTPDIKSYLRMTDPDDKFPSLSRGDDNPGLLSTNSDAIDLANSRTPKPETWNTHNRYRSSHQSMPQNGLNLLRMDQLGSPSSGEKQTNNPRHMARHSLELNLLYGEQKSQDTVVSTAPSSRPLSLQAPFSTTDISTLSSNGFGPAIASPTAHSEQFHQHSASINRITAGTNGTSARDSPDHEEPKLPNGHNPVPSSLQANAPPFGPQVLNSAIPPQPLGSANALPNFQNSFYNYNPQPYMTNTLPVNGGPLPNYAVPAPTPYQGYPPYGNFRFPESSPARNGSSRRNGETESSQVSRFSNVPLEKYRGEIYSLCKDQHGCRYLQRKLEEHNQEHVKMIFDETHMHVVELMTDPFGNYLCQKLLEFSNEEQRTTLIHNAAPQLVKIALNQHGTRALQKMIEFVTTPEQTQTVIRALRDRVVDLVQDLNGNHVIQKCLNRLSPEDSQFIYDAVGANCVVVGTHRHGCCVLQRCIDHASGEQRAKLIAQITANAFTLVQDPFGNYVVQYILDLSEPHFTEPLCQKFLGNVVPLSKQKFSSNVIEKCLRTADYQMRKKMIDEMLAPNEMERMLRDSFANYVVQTAMDFADPESRSRLIDAIRPILPSIRQTPHGRRIAGKINGNDGSGRNSGNHSGQVTPNEMLPPSMQLPQKPFLHQHQPHQQHQQQNSLNGSAGHLQDSVGGSTPPNSSASAVAGFSTPVNGSVDLGSGRFSSPQVNGVTSPTQAQVYHGNGYF